MTKALDQGDIILQHDLAITSSMNASQLHDVAAEIGSDLTLQAIDLIEKGQDKAIPQTEEGVTYASKIQKSESKIDFNKTGSEILNLIRGLADYPGAYMEFKGKRLKIFKAEFTEQEHHQNIGAVILDKNSFVINCRNGVIKPLIIQLEGKQKMSVEDFLKGQN